MRKVPDECASLDRRRGRALALYASIGVPAMSPIGVHSVSDLTAFACAPAERSAPAPTGRPSGRAAKIPSALPTSRRWRANPPSDCASPAPSRSKRRRKSCRGRKHEGPRLHAARRKRNVGGHDNALCPGAFGDPVIGRVGPLRNEHALDHGIARRLQQAIRDQRTPSARAARRPCSIRPSRDRRRRRSGSRGPCALRRIRATGARPALSFITGSLGPFAGIRQGVRQGVRN